MLIAARALAGAGGGGIVNSVWVINSDVVPVRSRTNWSLALSVTWACSAVAGPLLGGVFSGAHYLPLTSLSHSYPVQEAARPGAGLVRLMHSTLTAS